MLFELASEMDNYGDYCMHIHDLKPYEIPNKLIESTDDDKYSAETDVDSDIETVKSSQDKTK